MTPQWLAQRTNAFDSSGIRKVFDLASSLKDPINLSIGQPDFDVPHDVRLAAVDAIQSGKNGYALTHGMPVLREKLQTEIDGQYNHSDRRVLVTSGVSGGLLLAIFALLDPGDEVIVFDPYFVMYEPHSHCSCPLCGLRGANKSILLEFCHCFNDGGRAMGISKAPSRHGVGF